MNSLGIRLIVGFFFFSLAACTGQVPGTYRYAQQDETYASNESVNTKIDMLWVVDNSSSMDPVQKKLRSGFAQFAQTYLKPTWDIRLAVIPTDLYLANPVFWTNNGANTAYLNRKVGTGNTSDYLAGLVTAGKFTNPLPGVYSTVSGTFPTGIAISNLVKGWGQGYSLLREPDAANGFPTAIHDGPKAGYCQEYLPYFLSGQTNCAVRDDTTRANGTGTTLCLNPGAGNSIEECVNTQQNNTVHSGKVVIATKPPTGTAGDAAWVQTIIDQFTINASVGSVGGGAEMPFASVKQLLDDNEASGSSTAFFRQGAFRVIVFVTDEEDQSKASFPAVTTSTYSPFTDYKCDANRLKQDNYTKWKNYYMGQGMGAAAAEAQAQADVDQAVSGAGGFCCSGGGCRYEPASYTDSNGNPVSGCPVRTLNRNGTGSSTSVHLCPDPSNASLLMPVSTFKSTLDTFFKNLDSSTTPNYMVATITIREEQTFQDLLTARTSDDDDLDSGATLNLRKRASDRCERCTELADSVGNGSVNLDIGANDYSVILEEIGRSILSQKGTFTLRYSATQLSDLIVWIVRSDGSQEQVPYSKLSLSGNTIRITDDTVVLGLREGDSIRINYQPSSLN